MKRCMAPLLALLLAGCGGPPTRFYALALTPPPQAPAAAPCPSVRQHTKLTVDHVLLPETLDRQSIVRDAGPHRLQISNQDRWAAPLDGMIQRVLAEDLRQRLPPGTVLVPGDPMPPGGAASIKLNVRRFAAQSDGAVTLAADWTLLDAGGTPTPVHASTLREAGGTGTNEMVASMSTVLGKLADRIAAKALGTGVLCRETGADTRN